MSTIRFPVMLIPVFLSLRTIVGRDNIETAVESGVSQLPQGWQGFGTKHYFLFHIYKCIIWFCRNVSGLFNRKFGDIVCIAN